MKPDIDERLNRVRVLGEAACEAMLGEINKCGLPAGCIDPVLDRASFELSRDPFDGNYSLIGIWRDDHGQKQGEILFHSDGSFMAEYDVISAHPGKPHWFVEAVTAWGNHSKLNAELRLLRSVG